MNTTLEKIEKEISKIDRFAWITIPIFTLAVIFSPYIFTRSWLQIDFSQTGDIGSTIGGITAPFIGILSAFLVFVSFRAQINANKYQLEEIYTERKNRKLENEIVFIYHRLEEIKTNNISPELNETLGGFNGFLNDLVTSGYTLIKGGVHNSDYISSLKKEIEKIEKEKIKLSLVLSRQLSLYVMIQNRLQEIESQIDNIQLEYINSSLRYEYMKNLGGHVKTYIEKIDMLTFHELLNEKSLLLSIRRNCILLNDKLFS